MTRSELIAQLAARNPHLRQADVELIVQTVFDQITSALARGQRVELRGFGGGLVACRLRYRYVSRNGKVSVKPGVSIGFMSSGERYCDP